MADKGEAALHARQHIDDELRLSIFERMEHNSPGSDFHTVAKIRKTKQLAKNSVWKFGRIKKKH